MKLNVTPEQLKILDEKFSQLKDNRSFEQYMNDILEHREKQMTLCEWFIVTLAINGVDVSGLRESGCEKSSELEFHFCVDDVTTEPDYEAKIEGLISSLEFKGTNKNISHIMIKKYDIDKYALKQKCLIIHIIDTDGDHPRFTILTPSEVQKWKFSNDEAYFGNKEIYTDPVISHKYFTMKILDAGLKSMVRYKLGVVEK